MAAGTVDAEITLSPLDWMQWKLSLFDNGPINYNVIDSIGVYQDRQPQIRLEALLDRCGMLKSLDQAKLLRPKEVYSSFNTFRSAWGATVDKMFSGADFTSKFTAVLDSVDTADIESLEKNLAMATFKAKLAVIRASAQTDLNNAKSLVNQLSKTDAEFCALDWIKQMETAKNNRLAQIEPAITGLSNALNTMLKTDPKAMSLGWGNKVALRYRTDEEWHKANGNKLIAVYKNNSLDSATQCNCQDVPRPSEWLRAAWTGDTPNIDGRGPNQVFCMRFDDQLKPVLYSDLSNMFRTAATGNEPNLHFQQRAIWRDNAVAWPRDDGVQEWSIYYGWRSEITYATHLANGLWYELESQVIIPAQWKVLQRAVRYLEQVAAMRKYLLAPMETLQKGVNQFATLAAEIDNRVGDILQLKLHLGSHFVIRAIMIEMAKNLDRMHHAWTRMNTKGTIIKYAKPLTNSFDTFLEYHIVVPGGRTPHHWRWEQSQNPNSTVVYRPIPFPFPRATPATVLCGLSRLAYGPSKDIIASLQFGGSSNTGFVLNVSSTLLRDHTNCYDFGVSWMDIAPRHFQLVYQNSVDFPDAISATVANKPIPNVPDRFKDASGKTMSSTHLVCWLNGFSIEKGKDFNIIADVAQSDDATAKVTLGGNTHMKWGSVQFILYKDAPDFPIYCQKCRATTWTPEGNTKFNNVVVDFGGKFQSPPKFFFALTEVHADSTKDLRLGSAVIELSKDKAVVRLYTWDESILYKVGIVCIAIPDTDQFTV